MKAEAFTPFDFSRLQALCAEALRELPRFNTPKSFWEANDGLAKFAQSETWAETKRMIATVRAGEAHRAADKRDAYGALMKLEAPTVRVVLPGMIPPPRPRGRRAGIGPHVAADEKILQQVELRAASGEDPIEVITELASIAKGAGDLKSRKARLMQKWRKRIKVRAK
jgi:hypothetical protein